VPAKGPVDVLVIDHIERPSENWDDRRTLAPRYRKPHPVACCRL